MTIDERLGIGITMELGQHIFEADEIKEFASRYDPQLFHIDEEAGRRSVFGALCASGWHTAARWMRANIDAHQRNTDGEEGPGKGAVLGPSPGFENLKWLKPVYVGDTISFTRTPIGHRPLRSRPGWRLLTSQCEAHNQHGETVMRFQSSALVKVE